MPPPLPPRPSRRAHSSPGGAAIRAGVTGGEVDGVPPPSSPRPLRVLSASSSVVCPRRVLAFRHARFDVAIAASPRSRLVAGAVPVSNACFPEAGRAREEIEDGLRKSVNPLPRLFGTAAGFAGGFFLWEGVFWASSAGWRLACLSGCEVGAVWLFWRVWEARLWWLRWWRCCDCEF